MQRLAIIAPWEVERDLQAALDSLTRLNEYWLRRMRAPQLYSAGVRYEREPLASGACTPCWNPDTIGAPQPTEQWLSAPIVLQEGAGDCEDLACFRAAELRLQGLPARAVARRAPVGWHIVVERSPGVFEDPSRMLGMRSRVA